MPSKSQNSKQPVKATKPVKPKQPRKPRTKKETINLENTESDNIKINNTKDNVKEDVKNGDNDAKSDQKPELFDYKTDTFNIIGDYVKNYFNKHHTDSFNKFIDETLQQIIDQFSFDINYDFDPDNNKYRYEIKIEFLDYFIEEPVIYENNGSHKRITPSIAMLRNLSYSAPFHINIKVRCLKRTGEFLEIESIEE